MEILRFFLKSLATLEIQKELKGPKKTETDQARHTSTRFAAATVGGGSIDKLLMQNKKIYMYIYIYQRVL